ncbi:MAG: ATP-binding protein [Clostridia bacterium]|nr:ATP-binding protein [Clostridia bacterium]
MSLRKEIAPKGITFNANDFFISDNYATILTVVSYPGSIYPGYLASLISGLSGVKVVAKHIPIAFSVLAKMLNKQLADIQDRYQREHDVTVQERLRQDYDSLNEFITTITNNQSRVFDFQLHIMITAQTKEQLEQRKVQVKDTLEGMQLRAIPLRFEQEKVLKSCLPIFERQDIEDRIGTPIPSPTLAAMYPFIFDCIKDPGLSCLLGVDFSGGIILFNQFLYQIKKEHNRNNANMILLGTSGSGKSTAAKLMLRTHIRNEYKIIAIDPEGEYEDMTKLYDGDFINLGLGGEYGMINPLEIVADVDKEEAGAEVGKAVFVSAIQTLKTFMMYYDPSIEEDVLNLFNEVVIETYQRFNINVNTDFSTLKSEDYPTFSDVYKTIRGRILSYGEATKERDLMEKLELKVRPLTYGGLEHYFDGHTTITPKSNFIVFNIREIMNAEENVRNALFFNILKHAWSLSLDTKINSVLVVDEAHMLLGNNNQLGANFLANIQRRARKYNTGTIIITQEPSDFAAPAVLQQGKAIFDNSSYYLVMNLKKQAVEDLGNLIDLNDNEKESIKRYNQGEGLFVCGNKKLQISIIVTQAELDSFGTKGGL